MYKTVVQSVLFDPASGRTELPQLFDLLGAEDASIRLSSALAICLVADAVPETLEPITRELVEVLTDDDTEDADVPFEAELALAYLGYAFEEDVSDVIDEVNREAAVADVRARAHEGGFARSDYSGVNREPGGDGEVQPVVSEGPGSVITNDDPESDEDPPDKKELDELLDADEVPSNRYDHQSKLDRVAKNANLDEIAEESVFDQLHLVSSGNDSRYTTIFLTRAVRQSEDYGVAINVYQYPDSEQKVFAADMSTELNNWGAIADNDAVVGIHDWGMSPVPWAATGYTAQTLYDRTPNSLSEAVRHALTIADAISDAHQQGIIHAGIDPHTVVFTDGVMSDREKPLVKNFGLMNALRQYFDPSTLLDPRYAAPEYFDSDYGEIDHATDIYQLGAIIYKLMTGRAPFNGNYSEIRQQVLHDQPPSPSEINPKIPGPLDDVIHKAIAKQKISRTETATQLANEIRRLT